MMAVGLTSGALLLLVLIGTSYSLPVKGGDQGSSGGGDSGNPGSVWQAPSGGYVRVGSGSGSRLASNPVAAYGPYAAAAAAPGPVQYPGGFVPGSVQPGAVAAGPEAYSWEVDPVKPLAVERSPPSRVAGDAGQTEESGSTSLFLPPPPTYQGGELAHVEKSYEHGNSDSETEDQGNPRFPRGPVPFLPGGPIPVDGSAPFPIPGGPGVYPLPGGPGFGYPWYPYYDYLFLTGQYPPGTVSHFSSSYEQGRDHYHDNHYVRDLPVFPGVPQVPGQQQKQQFGSVYGRSSA